MDRVIDALIAYYKEDREAFPLIDPDTSPYANGSYFVNDLKDAAAESVRRNEDYNSGLVDHMGLIPLVVEIVDKLTKDEITTLGKRLMEA